LAEVNPLTPAFDRLADVDEVTFLPMEAVWPGARLDISQRRAKASVSTGYTRFQDGDVLVPKITPTFEAARAVLIGGLHRGVGAGSTELHVLRPRPNIDPRFLLYVVNTHPFLKLGKAEMYGVAGQQRVPDSFLRDLPVVLPALEEQRRIADFLDAESARSDRLYAARQRQVELFEERQDAIWGSTVSADAARAGWTPIRRFIDAITDGPFGSALTSGHYADSGARVIRLGNIGRAAFRDRDAAFIPSDYFSELRRHEAVAGDLIVAGLGDQNNPLGRACVVPEGLGDAMVKADCFRLRLDKTRMLHEYAAWVLSSPPVAERIALLARGSTRARINLEVVREIVLPAPSLREQRVTIGLLSELRSSAQEIRDRCSRQLILLAERRTALITAAVTGQFDVSTASGRGIED
jgi:type I restriction enzyme S subunit